MWGKLSEIAESVSFYAKAGRSRPYPPDESGRNPVQVRLQPYIFFTFYKRFKPFTYSFFFTRELYKVVKFYKSFIKGFGRGSVGAGSDDD
jgi:hypothetical protein